MMSAEYIQAISAEHTLEAKRENYLPTKARFNGDKQVLQCKFLGHYLPEGYTIINTFFVDNSGFGQEGEPALTGNQFLSIVKQGNYYAVKEAGEFQVYINEYTRK